MGRRYSSISFFLFKDFTYLFLEKGEGKEKEQERNNDAGSWPATWACAPTGN